MTGKQRMRRVAKPAGNAQDAFRKAASGSHIEGIIKLGRNAEREAKKMRRPGIYRFICASEIACLLAIDTGTSHLYSISRMFGASDATFCKALSRLAEANLIEAVGSMEGFELVNGRARKIYSLTEMGKDLLAFMRKHQDPVLATYESSLGKDGQKDR